MVKQVLCGNTIRFEATFKNFNKELTDPDLVKFILYNENYGKIEEFSANKSSLGVFYYDHVVNLEDKGKAFIGEMYGEINGKPSLDREEFVVTFKR